MQLFRSILIFVFIIIFANPFHSSAQNPAIKPAIEKLKAGKVFEKKGQYKEAIASYQLALIIFSNHENLVGVAVSLQNIGMMYNLLGKYDKAIEHFFQSFSVFSELKSGDGMARVLTNIGSLYKSWGKYDKAIEHYQAALVVEQKLGREGKVSTLLRKIGLIHKLIGENDKALEYLEKGLAINQKLRKEDKVSSSLTDIGLIHHFKGQYNKALEYLEKALVIDQKIGKKDAVSRSLNNLGIVYQAKGQYDKAIKLHQEALKIDRKLGVSEYIATDLNNIGLMHHLQGQYEEAIEHYQESLAIDRELGKKDTSITLNNIGMVYRVWGRYEKAMEYFQQGLDMNRKLGNEAETAINFSNIGLVYGAWGQYDKAIENFKKALEVNRKFGRQGSVPTNLNNIGMIHQKWGQYDKAISIFQQALTIQRNLDSKNMIETLLGNIGEAHFRQGRYDKAMEYYQRGLAIARKLGKEDRVAIFLGSIGLIYKSSGKYDKAIEHFKQGLAISRKLGNAHVTTTAINNFGTLLIEFGKYDKALDFFTEALTRYRKLKTEEEVAMTLSNIGAVFYLQGQYVSAIKYFKESISLIEKLRKTATGDARRDYLATQIVNYEILISSYLKNEEAANAFKVMEQSRSRVLAENLIDGKSDFNIISLESVQNEMKSSSFILSYANAEWPEISLVTITKANIRGQKIPVVEDLDSILKTYEARIQTMTENQRGIKVVGKDLEKPALEMADKKSVLEKTINFYRTLIKNPSPENNKALREIARLLYDLFIKPIETHIDDKKELIIIPDGILGFLPFETLIDSEGRYLVEKYVIRYAQSMTVQQLIKNRQYESNRKPMLALGGAVYDEISYEAEMVTNEKELDFIKNKTFLAMANERSMGNAYASLGIEALSNLPGTLDEINAIRKTVKNSETISGKEVTEARIKSMSDSGELSKYKVLHFATHGMTVPAFPELSAIVLSRFKEGQGSEDGYLRMGEIAKLKLNADFVNLSACETGLGKIYGGEGIVGLTQSFLIAGANGLSVSLWNVSDDSTAMFMVGVYQLVAQEGINYSRAINEMKRIFIQGQVSMDTFEPSRGITVIPGGKARPGKLSHPFYWAPFVYYGRN